MWTDLPKQELCPKLEESSVDFSPRSRLCTSQLPLQRLKGVMFGRSACLNQGCSSKACMAKQFTCLPDRLELKYVEVTLGFVMVICNYIRPKQCCFWSAVGRISLPVIGHGLRDGGRSDARIPSDRPRQGKTPAAIARLAGGQPSLTSLLQAIA